MVQLAKNCNIIILKYLIEKYNINPHCLFDERDGTGDSLLHAVLNFNYNIKSAQLLTMVKYLCELGIDVNLRGKRSRTPIELLVDSTNNFNECRLPIFTLLLLEHKAVIRNIDWIIRHAVDNNHLSILQHLIKTHQPSTDIHNVQPSCKIPLLHYIIRERPTIEFITYILSLNTININHKDGNGKTPIQYAITHKDLNINIIKLLVGNGATVTINDWLLMFGPFQSAYCCNPYQLFQRLNYFKDTCGWDIAPFSLQHHSQLHTTPLLQFSLKRLDFRYSTIKHLKHFFNQIIIYRTLIHHYKANVNEQDLKNNNNTIFHNLATYNHYELIQFTLLHSHSKPNIYLVNNHGETFLHTLVSQCDQWAVNDADEQQRKEMQQSNRSSLDGIQRTYSAFKLILTDDEINNRNTYLSKILDSLLNLL